MGHLSAVPNPQQQSIDREQAGYQPFQNKEVTEVTLSIKGTVKLPVDRELQVDDLIRVTTECRVTGINYAVNEKDGTLGRHQAAKVIDVEFTPWDPEDPHDTGVMR